MSVEYRPSVETSAVHALITRQITAVFTSDHHVSLYAPSVWLWSISFRVAYRWLLPGFVLRAVSYVACRRRRLFSNVGIFKWL